MKKFRFHWLDGKTSEGEGDTPADALRRLGYGGGAVRALDWWEEVK
jgi:hypothetical protein